MSDPSSQPAQPLTDACPTCSGPTRETTHMICLECGTDYAATPPRKLTDNALEVLRAGLAEVKRLRAELDSMTRFAEDLREERDRRLRAEGERGVERDALAAKIEATAELHPAWFCETCNSPGPCLTRLRLGLDQDGNGTNNTEGGTNA